MAHGQEDRGSICPPATRSSAGTHLGPGQGLPSESHTGHRAPGRRARSGPGLTVWLLSSVISSWQAGGCFGHSIAATGAATSLNLTTTLSASNLAAFQRGGQVHSVPSIVERIPSPWVLVFAHQPKGQTGTHSWATRRQRDSRRGTGVVQPRASGSQNRLSPLALPRGPASHPSSSCEGHVGLPSSRTLRK